ncbi:fibronectin type III domain-containing protein [Streptomyces sp. NPDC056264]|uniref:fibronectin type III domain-containing protein n=1 Tax=Streptomyces sp. NPDC056264 TaxID=3345767 RepID=UPI003AB08464
MSDPLEGTIDVPKIGKVKKVYVILPAAAIGGYLLWGYWRARNAGDEEVVPVDPGFEGEVLPVVPGAISSGGGGLPGSAEPPNESQFGFHGTTNDQWSQYAANQLVRSATWEYTTIVTALGQFLANRPLTSAQRDIVQAAIAVAGYPPVGNHVIIPGGDTAVLVAPSGLSGSAVSDTAIALSWSPVAGASSYVVERSGASGVSANGTSATVSGLSPSTSYSFTVAAVSDSGQMGPKSSSVTVTTKAKTTTPTPSTPTPSTPAPAGKRYPTKWKTVKNGKGSSYSSIAAREKLNITGRELYDYQFTAQAGRPESTKAELRKRGADLIYADGSTVLPYPR